MKKKEAKSDLISDEKKEVEILISKLQVKIENWYPVSIEACEEYNEMLLTLDDLQRELETLTK